MLLFDMERAGAQGTVGTPYVSPTAASSGMTMGLENGATSETMHMMQVRAAAQEAERTAAAAAMARAANASIEENSLNTALEKARRTRQAKMQASEELKWQRVTSYNAYNKVSPSEMATWKDAEGNIKVGREIPADFAASVKKQEAADAAASQKGQKNFQPIKKIGDQVARAVGVEEPKPESGLSMPKPLPVEPVAPPPGGDGRSFTMPKFRLPKIPFPQFGNKEPEAATPSFAAAPPQQAPPTQAPPQMASSSASSSSQARPAASLVPTEAVATARSAPAPRESSPVVIQKARSGADMMRADTGSPAPQVGNQATKLTAPAPTVAAEEKKAGWFSRRQSEPEPVMAMEPEQKKLFGFGRKNEPAPPAISSSLFPSDLVPGAPVGNGTTGLTQASAPSVALPAVEPESKKRFSLPVPKLPTPKGIGKAASGVSSTSVINRNGNSYYIVEQSAQFMKYGATPTDTTILAVSPGMIVNMTKPGEGWATVQLQNGSTGVIETKNLRAALSSEIPAITP